MVLESEGLNELNDRCWIKNSVFVVLPQALNEPSVLGNSLDFDGTGISGSWIHDLFTEFLYLSVQPFKIEL